MRPIPSATSPSPAAIVRVGLCQERRRLPQIWRHQISRQYFIGYSATFGAPLWRRRGGVMNSPDSMYYFSYRRLGLGIAADSPPPGPSSAAPPACRRSTPASGAAACCSISSAPASASLPSSLSSPCALGFAMNITIRGPTRQALEPAHHALESSPGASALHRLAGKSAHHRRSRPARSQ